MNSSAPLGRRALGRALLGRQHLLARAELSPLAMVEHLVGMQAQAPLAPYVGLWSRLAAFDPADAARLLTSREAVRASLMRSTIHLVSARDCTAIRPITQAVARASFTGHFGRAARDIDLDAVAEVGRELLDREPMTRARLRTELGARFPGHDVDGLAYAVSYLVPTVWATPRGVWGETGPAAMATIESWLGRPPDPCPSVDTFVRRYLAAFGPATVRDVQVWSGLTRLAEVVDRLSDLRRFRAEDGRELLDVGDGPLPDPDTLAPPRFLPEYDNVLLSHADRGHVIPDGRRVPLPPGNGASCGTLLVDGTYRADWRLARAGEPPGLDVTPFTPLTLGERIEIAEEGARLLALLSPDATPGTAEVRIG